MGEEEIEAQKERAEAAEKRGACSWAGLQPPTACSTCPAMDRSQGQGRRRRPGCCPASQTPLAPASAGLWLACATCGEVSHPPCPARVSFSSSLGSPPSLHAECHNMEHAHDAPKPHVKFTRNCGSHTPTL